MNNKTLSTQSYKGARDFYPEEMQVRNYIFETWRRVCKSFGYQEYDGPFLESFEIYEAKTGEEIVNEQLYSFEDRAGRKLAIRPEMTPTLARMVAQQYKTLVRPIRWFSMPNLWRYEAPQRGRLREHFQLNVDIFGVDGIEADFEIISTGIEIMKAFGATKEMFELRVGNRRLIEDFYSSINLRENQKVRVSKTIDKMAKISPEEFNKTLVEQANLTKEQFEVVNSFLESPEKYINNLAEANSIGAKEITDLLELSQNAGYGDFVKYDPKIMRGFDYYTGNVFEQFDLNPNNNRSMYGGGRYDDLVELFVKEKIPGVGYGMGDVTLANFLEDWNLLPNFNSEIDYVVTVWPSDNEQKYLLRSQQVARALRQKNQNVIVWLDKNTKINKQLKFANRKNAKYVVIIGENEFESKEVTIKNMVDGTQKTIPQANL